MSLRCSIKYLIEPYLFDHPSHELNTRSSITRAPVLRISWIWLLSCIGHLANFLAYHASRPSSNIWYLRPIARLNHPSNKKRCSPPLAIWLIWHMGWLQSYRSWFFVISFRQHSTQSFRLSFDFLIQWISTALRAANPSFFDLPIHRPFCSIGNSCWDTLITWCSWVQTNDYWTFILYFIMQSLYCYGLCTVWANSIW